MSQTEISGLLLKALDMVGKFKEEVIMKTEVHIKFKDGIGMLAKQPHISDVGLWYLDDDISLNCNSGVLYQRKDNVICGEDITNTVSEIRISIKY